MLMVIHKKADDLSFKATAQKAEPEINPTPSGNTVIFRVPNTELVRVVEFPSCGSKTSVAANAANCGLAQHARPRSSTLGVLPRTTLISQCSAI